MSHSCPTVTIMTKNGPVRINEEDFDEKTMKLATDAEIAKAAPKKGDGKASAPPANGE